MSTKAELVHLFRALKAPAAAGALPELAKRARDGSWSYERFAEELLGAEHLARSAHGGEARIRAARFPARKSLDEFDFSFQKSVSRQVLAHLAQLDFLAEAGNGGFPRPSGGPARRTVSCLHGSDQEPWKDRAGSGRHDSKDSLARVKRCLRSGSVCFSAAGTDPGPPRCWPDQKPVRPSGRDASQSCHACPSSRAGHRQGLAPRKERAVGMLADHVDRVIRGRHASGLAHRGGPGHDRLGPGRAHRAIRRLRLQARARVWSEPRAGAAGMGDRGDGELRS
jgi:hypothetical protein